VLTSFGAILVERRARHAAVGAFTCYDMSTALGVVRAAEERQVPVVLLVSEASFVRPEARLFVPALVAVAREAAVPACVQLDHVSDASLVEAAFELGVGAALADGSDLDTDENVSLVRRARAVAPAGAGIEAELGHVAGGEDVTAAATAGKLTDPDEARAFAASTEIDCLAVSIGNVHGTYASEPELDWSRLEEIRRALPDLPLALHGASGLPADDVRRAVSLGICKVNVNTELRGAYLRTLADGLERWTDGLRVLELQSALVAALALAAGSTLDVLDSRV
jgi:tagatose 1,6-diphosphate aldolase GatY/KbaY